MENLRTKQTLLDALVRSAHAPKSADERHRQKVSYIMGTLGKNSSVTRDRVEFVLQEQEGKVAA